MKFVVLGHFQSAAGYNFYLNHGYASFISDYGSPLEGAMSRRKILTLSFSAAAMLSLATVSALAQGTAVSYPMSRPRASMELLGDAGARLSVTTPSWTNGADIPFEYTQYEGNRFPGLMWSAGPAGTKSYAIVMQDVDSPRGTPILHWTMYDIPAATTELPTGMRPDEKPAGSYYGPNYRGNEQPYLGPRTPPGPKHHYYLQVFALDKSMQPNPEITYDALAAQMKGHVLAAGETMGLGQAESAR